MLNGANWSVVVIRIMASHIQTDRQTLKGLPESRVLQQPYGKTG